MKRLVKLVEFNHTNAKGLASVLFMNYKDTILRVFELQKFGMKFGLDSMCAILARLGNPEQGGKFIHQADNARLALAILEELPSLGYAIFEGAVRSGLRNARWPGRGELFPLDTWPADGSGKALLILDGAHNPDGAKAFSGFLAWKMKQNMI
jgi:folylpolyglutamate synthase/dihydropteroate synthase